MHLAKADNGAVLGLPPKNLKWFAKGKHGKINESPSKESCKWSLITESTLYTH